MRVGSLAMVLLILAAGSSCRLAFPNLNMFDQQNVLKAFAAFQYDRGGTLVEVEISRTEVVFNTGTERFVYSRGFLREDRFKSPSEWNDFRLDDVELSGLGSAMSAALELAGKNPYLSEPAVSRVVISKKKVDRDDNLVSNIGKWHEAMRWEIHVADSDQVSRYTTNQRGEIVDIAVTNIQPRVGFQDVARVRRLLAETKPRFGGRLSVASLDINLEDLAFEARDPKNPDEINIYRIGQEEILRAYPSLWRRTPQERRQEEAMRRGGASEEEVRRRFPRPDFFDVDEIDLSLMPKVMQEALATVELSRPRITSIEVRKVESRRGGGLRLQWRVEAHGDRSETDFAIFDEHGDLENAGAA